MDEDAIMAAIKAELRRQCELPTQETPYLYNADEDSDLWGIDGYVDIRDLARAIAKLRRE
jgi:hypothetical protein